MSVAVAARQQKISDQFGKIRRRCSDGETPTIRLNARLKAASEL